MEWNGINDHTVSFMSTWCQAFSNNYTKRIGSKVPSSSFATYIEIFSSKGHNFVLFSTNTLGNCAT